MSLLRIAGLAAALTGLMVSSHVQAAGTALPPHPTFASYCPEPLGTSDTPWPAYSDSPAVNAFRDQIIFVIKSLYGFEYDASELPEEVLTIGNPPRQITVPMGWMIAMDAVPGGYTTAVAIPPVDGPFADETGLRAVLEQKVRIFGGGGAVTMPTPADPSLGVRLPCSPNDPTQRAPAIILGVPYQGQGTVVRQLLP